MALSIGCLHVGRCVFINATPSRVWQEFVDFEHLNRWFGRGHTLESFQRRVGAEVRLSIDNGTRPFGGPLLVFDPQQEISFEDNWYGADAWPVSTFVTLRLQSCYDGTLVELFHHGFERLYEKGWTAWRRRWIGFGKGTQGTRHDVGARRERGRPARMPRRRRGSPGMRASGPRS